MRMRRRREGGEEKEEKEEKDDVSVTGCRLRSTGIGSGSTVDTCSYVSPVHASRGHYFYAPLYLAVLVRCCLPEEYLCCFFFWRRLLDFFPYSALLGSTVNTCFFHFTEAYVLGSCDRFSSCSLLPYTAQYFFLSGTCHSSVYRFGRISGFFYVKRWITDPEVFGTCFSAPRI